MAARSAKARVGLAERYAAHAAEADRAGDHRAAAALYKAALLALQDANDAPVLRDTSVQNDHTETE
jgi:hypothetical protein